MQKSRQNIYRIVSKLYERMDQHGETGLNKNELLTRYVLIDPVLRELGWDTENPEKVVVANPIRLRHKRRGSPDYTLFDEGRKAAYIEAKQWGTISRIKKIGNLRDLAKRKELQQLTRYCRDGNVPIGILTDGGAWYVFGHFEERSITKRIAMKIDLGEDSKQSVVTNLLKLRPSRISRLLTE